MIYCQWDHPQISGKAAPHQRSLPSGRGGVVPRPNLTHGDGQTDEQSDANCLHCHSHGTTPPPVAMGNLPHHGNQLAVSLVCAGGRERGSLFVVL